MIDLESKVAIVTGAGRGIGRAVSLGLFEAGASVMCCDLDVQPIPAGMEMLVGDMTDPAFPQRLVDETLKRFGSIDIIVNNAGYTWDNVIQKTTDEQFQAMLDIHIIAPFRLLRAAAPWLRETAKKEAARGKTVMRKAVNITSISGLGGNAGQAGYSAGKAGIVGLTKTIAKEWGRYNVTGNAVAF